MMFIGSMGAFTPFARFPTWIGPRVWLPWALYLLVSNPLMLLYGTSLEGSSRIALSQSQLLMALAGATALAAAGATGMAATMNASHRQSFFGGLCLNAYVQELWQTRTYAPVGSGHDASRAHLLKFSRWGRQQWGAHRFRPMIQVFIKPNNIRN